MTTQITREETHYHHVLRYSFCSVAKDVFLTTAMTSDTMAFTTPIVQHWLGHEMINESTMRDRSDDPPTELCPIPIRFTLKYGSN